MRSVFWLGGIVLVVILTALSAQERPGSPRPGSSAASAAPALDEIGGEDIAAHLKFLADDLLEGRAPSTRGGQLAANYLAAQLALLGFAPTSRTSPSSSRWPTKTISALTFTCGCCRPLKATTSSR
jgi:hypothetical protein